MAGYGASNWWDAPQGAVAGTSAVAAQPDYLAALSPTLSSLGNTVPLGAEGGPGMWGGVQDWFNDSGVLGKTLADGTKVQGWGMPALGVAQGLGNAFFGLKQYQLARDTLDQNKRQFQLNFDAQRKTTNAALNDRQNARVASNPGAYQSVGDYMKQYGI